MQNLLISFMSGDTPTAGVLEDAKKKQTYYLADHVEFLTSAINTSRPPMHWQSKMSRK
jgi:hypothetical protein